MFVYYESIKRELKIRPIYECRCDLHASQHLVVSSECVNILRSCIYLGILHIFWGEKMWRKTFGLVLGLEAWNDSALEKIGLRWIV
jgi:hypothetical protein